MTWLFCGSVARRPAGRAHGGTRRGYVHVGSLAASLPPTVPPRARPAGLLHSSEFELPSPAQRSRHSFAPHGSCVPANWVLPIALVRVLAGSESPCSAAADYAVAPLRELRLEAPVRWSRPGTVERMDARYEPTWMYLRRVPGRDQRTGGGPQRNYPNTRGGRGYWMILIQSPVRGSPLG